MTDPSPPKSRRRRSLWIAAGTFAALAAALAWVWNGPAAAPSARIASFSIERQPDGTWSARPDNERALKLAIGATGRHSQSNTSSSRASASAQGARMPTRSVLVTTGDDSPLAQAIAMRVVDALQQDDYVRRISYRPAGEAPTPGVAMPDLVLELDLHRYEDETRFGSGRVQASLSARLGTGIRRGPMRTVDTVAPPRVDVGVDFSVNATIEQSGFATPNLVFDGVVDELTGSLLQHLRKELRELRDEHGVYPALPPAFAVSYEPIDPRLDLAALLPADTELRQLASWCAPLVHNETCWSGRVEATAEALHDWLDAAIEGVGYQNVSGRTSSQRRYRDGDRLITFEVVPPRRPIGVIHLVDPEESRYVEFFVCYRHFADAERVAQAYESVLDDGVPAEVLLLCAPKLPDVLRERGVRRLCALTLDDPGELILRARLRHGSADVAGAADDLLRAMLWSDASFDRQTFAEKAEQAAKQLGIELDRYGVAPEWLRANGFHELQVGGDPVEGTATGSVPLRCFVTAKDHDGREVARVFAVGPDRSADGSEWLGSLRVFDDGHTSSVGQSGAGTRSHQTAFGVIHYEFVDPPDDARAEVRVRVR
ncbi:MAG: hypothetical protein KAI24_00600 [Planctomycetes bacterium]|nr:hypothetical protein [Planctomycetota bacterium]